MRFDTRRGPGILVQYLSQGVVEVGHQWTAVRMYIVAPSEWGQQACDKLLGIARASDLHVTLIVPRRDELAFKSWPIGAWKGEYKSVRHACDELAKKGHPISYVYDDFLDAIRAQMLRERNEQEPRLGRSARCERRFRAPRRIEAGNRESRSSDRQGLGLSPRPPRYRGAGVGIRQPARIQGRV